MFIALFSGMFQIDGITYFTAWAFIVAYLRIRAMREPLRKDKQLSGSSRLFYVYSNAEFGARWQKCNR